MTDADIEQHDCFKPGVEDNEEAQRLIEQKLKDRTIVFIVTSAPRVTSIARIFPLVEDYGPDLYLGHAAGILINFDTGIKQRFYVE